MADLRELIARKKAEKEAAAEAAVVAAEAEKTANAKASAEVAAKITAAKALVLELLALFQGGPDEETLAVLEVQYTELPGLREAVEQEVRRQKADAEQKARWERVAVCEKRIENLPTDQLPYDLASEMVELRALEEIAPERKKSISAYNKTVREAGHPTHQTFVREAKEGKVVHFYLDKKPWASTALNKHHRMLEQSRKMSVRHEVKPTFSTGKPAGQTSTGAAIAKAKGAGEVVSPEVLPIEELEKLKKPSRKVRRAAKRLAEVGEGGPAKTDSRPAEKSRGGAGSDEGSRAMRGELPEA